MSEISLTVCDVCGEKASAEGAKNWRHIQLTDGNGYGKTWERDLCTSCWGKGEPLLGWPPSTRRNLETYFALEVGLPCGKYVWHFCARAVEQR